MYTCYFVGQHDAVTCKAAEREEERKTWNVTQRES